MFQKGNQLSVGIKNGRLGYTYEREQLTKMRQEVDALLAFMKAIRQGKLTDKGLKQFQVLLPAFLKLADKLHANKQEVDHKNLPQQNPTPILAPIFAQNVHIHNSNQENKRLDQENQSSTGGNISQQNGINHSVVDSPSPV